ncbi:MAG: hypothetical protein IJH86_01640 [Clostridia bacterium]|nr:hypothetical protein [Clostridia bacterium]
MAIFTGMRRGEIIGLRWGDIDLEGNILRVRRNVTYPKGTNDSYIGTTKTESGVRDIPIIILHPAKRFFTTVLIHLETCVGFDYG